jgi:hypothetical protein
MCGSRPSGPTQEQAQFDIFRMAQQQAQLAAFTQQNNEQQAAFAAQLEAQRQQAAAVTAQRQQELVAEQAAAATEAAAPNSTASIAARGPYATTVEPVTGTAANALTTATTGPKRKKSTSLKIAPGGIEASAGAGLNLGV